MKKIFIIGITGYIGGTIALKLKEKGYEVLGLARKDADINSLNALGFNIVKGSLQNVEVLRKAIVESDAVINTADSDDYLVVEDFLSLLRGTGKTFIYTSGSNIIANWTQPETADFVFTEDFPLETISPAPNRLIINDYVLRSAIDGVRNIVIVPSMVYGEGLLLNKESKQIPLLIKTAKDKNVGVYVGSGSQSWSNVHVEDLADLYIAALERAKPGSIFFAENGIASFKEIAEVIHHKLSLHGTPVSLSQSEAVSLWGDMMATMALGSDCRLNADKARLFLDWNPRYDSVLTYLQDTL